ncbi:MAG: saccharopine dehydrogenase NADP-binding domain-containing protein [Desulfobacterales bacterium]|jgi:saccharopine dehydrogenase-like NADP-dependent oxidoreductase
MGKILVVGAGGQGGPCAAILARDEEISEVRLGDINFELAQSVAAKINDPKVVPLQLNAGSKEEVIKASQGMEAIINLTLIDFNDTILAAALAGNTHYVDTACDYGYLKQMVEGTPLKFNAEFHDIGKTALMGCGATPGMSNVLIRYVCDQMDGVDKIYLRLGSAALDEPEDIVGPWNPGWSPEIALLDFAEKPMIFEDGRYKAVPIFSRHENHRFPEPFGTMLLASHSHEEPYTLPYFIGKGIKEVDFKYPVDLLAGAFVKMGFADDREIEVNGVKVIPRDVLMQLVPRPANEFLNETEASIEASSDFSWIMEISIEGTKEGRRYSHCLTETSILDRQAKLNLYRTFGTSHIGVALPAVVGAKMCLAGEADVGVTSSECLEPAVFFKRMAAMGLPVEFKETITRHTRIQ